jgi:hypothetical protein
MTSKTFVSGTVIDSAWLNDVNDSTYATDTAPVGSFRAAAETALAGKAASGANTDISSIIGNAATATVAANAIGQGQVWGNYVGSRVFSQTYTSPSRSIQVRAGWNTGSFGDALTATVGGVALYGSSTGVAGERVTIEFTVPPLTTYIVTNTSSGGSLNSWAELR